jgi:hypothetical protein
LGHAQYGASLVNRTTYILVAAIAAAAAGVVRMSPVMTSAPRLPASEASVASAIAQPLNALAASGASLTFISPLPPGATPRLAVDASAIKLSGVAQQGGRTFAVLQTPDGAAHIKSRGEEIGGWTIDRVGASSIRLVRGHTSVEKKLFDTTVTASPAAATASLPPASEDRGIAPDKLRTREPASAPQALYLPPPAPANP